MGSALTTIEISQRIFVTRAGCDYVLGPLGFLVSTRDGDYPAITLILTLGLEGMLVTSKSEREYLLAFLGYVGCLGLLGGNRLCKLMGHKTRADFCLPN